MLRYALALVGVLLVGSAAAADSIHVAVGGELPFTERVRGSFLGFSIETFDTYLYLGRRSAGPTKAFVNLLRTIWGASRCEHGITVRIGGNSADQSVYNPDQSRAVPNVTLYNITDDDLQGYADFLGAAPFAKLTIDLNFRLADDPSWAIAHAQAVNRFIDPARIASFQIGNEGDLYPNNGIRSPSYTMEQYTREWDAYARAISRAAQVPARPFDGATFCCNHNHGFFDGLQQYALQEAPLLNVLSYHRYPTTRCNGQDPTLAALLNASSSVGQTDLMRPVAQWARDAGVPFAVGETNSVSCEGTRGVSDTLGAALWGVDYLAQLTRINASHANVHGHPLSPYAPVGFRNVSGGGVVVDVLPMYYAMMMVSELTANGSAVLNVSAVSTAGSNVAAHAFQDGATGALRVAVVHKDLQGAGAGDAQVVVKLAPTHRSTQPGSRSLARLVRLLAPAGSVYSRYGLRYAGLTFDGADDGLPIGQREEETVVAAADGTFTFAMPPLTAAMLTVE